MHIHLRLAELARKKRGWNLRRLADELNVDYQNVLNWNTGRSTPRLTILVQIARLLRCTIDHLIVLPKNETTNDTKGSHSIFASSDILLTTDDMYETKPQFPKPKGRPPKFYVGPDTSSFSNHH